MVRAARSMRESQPMKLAAIASVDTQNRPVVDT
jgi:hypothetical protein